MGSTILTDSASGSSTFIVIYAAVFFISLAFSVLFMLSIGYDCKSRNDKKQGMWMALTFFFPLIAGIVYACTRNKKPLAEATKVCASCGAVIDSSMTFCPVCGQSTFSDDDSVRKKYKKTSNILFGVSVAVYVVELILCIVLAVSLFTTVFNTFEDVLDNSSLSDYDYDYYDSYSYYENYGYTEDGVTVYYDRLGNVYYESNDVVYYDEQGNTYTYDEDEYSFESEDDIDYYDDYCYVDENGYFCIDMTAVDSLGEEESITFDEDTLYYSDSDGKLYYWACEVSWDKDGNLVDSYTGDALE